MNNPATIEIHEFSTGIRAERTSDGGWVSRGFTGQYMNMTLESIPDVVERSIRNREFALTEGASSDSPAIIGRVVGSEENFWSVVAVVTRGKDEKGRSLSVYRYFLCEGKNLRPILAWWENQGRPRFNPFDSKTIEQPNLSVDSVQPPDLQQEFHDLRVDLPEPILLSPQQQYNLQTINVLAIKKSNFPNNGQPVSWAINVEALEQPKRFQVIQPASQRAYEILERTIRNTPQVLAPVVGDEEALKSAIRGLMNSSVVKPEAVKTITDALQNQQISKQYWHSLFDGQGAKTAISQKIYSPQMVRLITLRAMVIPETLPDFLDWLNVKGGKKPDENQTVSLDFQSQIRELFPKEILADGMKFILPGLLAKKITPDTAYWLLMGKGSAWFKIKNTFIDNIQYDLQLISNLAQTSTRQPPFPAANFKFDKQIWQPLINNRQFPHVNSLKIDSYKPLAELFEKLKQYPLAAYFYQVSDGVVPKDIYQKISNKIISGLTVKAKISKIESFLGFVRENGDSFIAIGIGFLLAGFAVAGVFVGKYFNKETSQSFGESKQKDENKKDFSDPVSETQPTNQKKALVLTKGLEEFNITSNAIEQMVKDINQENSEYRLSEIKGQLKSVLKNPKLQYGEAINDKPKTEKKEKFQTEWVEAIYNYQKLKDIKNPDGIINNTANTYKSLKEDIKYKLANSKK